MNRSRVRVMAMRFSERREPHRNGASNRNIYSGTDFFPAPCVLDALDTRGAPSTLDFSRMSQGDVLAACPSVVSSQGKGDLQPGVPPETRRIAGGAIVLIMPICADHMATASAQLVLRCEPDGRILAAINRAPST